MTQPQFLNDSEAAFALRATQSAAQLARQVQVEMSLPALTKGDRSPVTVADFAVQSLIGRLLREDFPEDSLVAEEESSHLQSDHGQVILAQVTEFVRRLYPNADPQIICEWIDQGTAATSRRFWALDPVDGTKGFLRGVQYAVALSLIEDGKVKIGVLGCPNLANGVEPDIGGKGSLLIAVRGQGSWVTAIDEANDFASLSVSDTASTSAARVLRSYEAGHTHTGHVKEILRVLGVQADPVLMDSQAKYALLAAGGGDLFLRLPPPENRQYQERIWDQAAGSIIVEEAGGRVTDMEGRYLDFSTGKLLRNNRGIVASNGHLHDAALRAVAAAVGQPAV